MPWVWGAVMFFADQASKWMVRAHAASRVIGCGPLVRFRFVARRGRAYQDSWPRVALAGLWTVALASAIFLCRFRGPCEGGRHRDQGLMMTIARFVAVAVLGFFVGLMPARAQGGPGTIRGQVTDPAGASIPAAVISANNGHRTSRSATTDVRGEYVLANLPAGAYTVRVSAKGFALAERSDVAVGSGATQTVNFPMSLDSAKQKILVWNVRSTNWVCFSAPVCTLSSIKMGATLEG
jgi:Carboxypeptidase regulatory-like domain